MAEYEFGKVVVGVEPDADGFGRKARVQIEAETETLEAKVDVVPDMSGLAALLKRQLREVVKAATIEVQVPVRLNIDRTQLRTDLRVVQEQVKAQNITLKLGVAVTKSEIAAEVRQIREQIRAEKPVLVPLKPTFDRRDLKRAIDEMAALAKVDPIEVRVRPVLDGDRARFVAEVKAFIASVRTGLPDLTINVRANTVGGARLIPNAVRKEVSEFDDKLKQIGKTAGALTGPLGGAGAQFARLTQTGSLAAAAIGGLGVAMGSVIGFGAKLAADAQLADTGITRLTKAVGLSATQAKSFIGQLEQFASVTPFEIPEVKEATKFLLGAGTAVEDILPTLQRITDLGATVGATTENISNVAKAFAKIQGKGTAQLLELNQIRRNLPGFDPVKAIADFKGQSLADTYAQISKKAIPAELAIAALNKAMAEQPGAAGAAAEQAQTLIGLYSTLKDTVQLGFKDAFLQPEVLNPLSGLLKDLTKNSRQQITEVARALGPVVTSFGPALQAGIALFVELTKVSAPFFVELLQGATTLTTKLIPAVHNLRGPLQTFGELIKTLAPVLGTVISLVASGVSPFGLMSVALRAIAPALQIVTDLIDGLPEPLRVILGLMIIINRQKIFSTITDAGPKSIEILKTMTKVILGLAEGGLDTLVRKLDNFATGSKAAAATASTAFRDVASAATASAAATSTALATIDTASFQRARVRAPGLPSGTLGLPSGIIDTTAVEKVAEIGRTSALAIEGVGTAAAGAAAKGSLFTRFLQSVAGGASAAITGVRTFLTSLSAGQLAVIAAGIALIVNNFRQAGKEAAIAAEGGRNFAESVIGGLNDTSKRTVDLTDTYLKDLRDKNSDLGKIFANQEFSDALAKRNETVSDYAAKLSKDSETAFEAFATLAGAAGDERGFFSRAGSAFGSDDTGSGIERILARQKSTVELLRSASGAGADTVQSVIKEQEKLLLDQGKFQRTFGTKNGIVFYNDELDKSGNKIADYNLLTEATVNKLKELGISYDFATGKTTVFDQATTDLANQLGISLDATDEYTKQIDGLSDSLKKTFDTIRGTDVLTGTNGLVSQLGGVSQQLIQLMRDGEITSEEIAGLATDLGITGDAAADLIEKGLKFGNLYVAEIEKTKEAFRGLIPTAGSVFEELKTKADGVLPSYSDLLSGLQRKLEESAAVGDNIGKIIARGGTGVIEVLKNLPAEAQAAYAAAIASADDKTFVKLEAKSRELNAEGIAQIQNQGLLAIATVDTAVAESLKPIAAAQAALEKKATEVRAKLRGEAQQPGLSPQQRRLLREDRDATTAASVASSGSELVSQVAGVTEDINAQLSTVPAAAKKANDDAVKGLLPLPQQITSATIPGLETWSGNVLSTTDAAANGFNSLAIRGVDAMQRLSNGIEAPAQRVLDIVGSMADAINSVSAQIGSGEKIVVPGLAKKYVGARTNKVEVKHSGGIVGDGVSSSRTNGPVASNEQLVLAQKGEGVIPADAMKRLGLEQFKFIKNGDVEGLLKAQQQVPTSRKQVTDARSLSPGVLGGMGPALAGTMDAAVGHLAKNVDKYLGEVSELINAKIGTTPGLISGANVFGGAGASAAATWIRAAMVLTGAPESWFTGLMTLAKRESGFNPRAINLWDSNAAKGTPSIGLMQTIGPTFRAYALPGYGDIYNPVHNAIASIRYIRARYGDISKVQQANPNKAPKGYEFGDLVTREQMARVGERNMAELILPLQGNPRRAEDLLERWLFDPTVSGVNPDRILERLEAAAERRGNRSSSSPGKNVTVESGGALVKLEMKGESYESLEAQLGTRANAIVSSLLS